MIDFSALTSICLHQARIIEPSPGFACRDAAGIGMGWIDQNVGLFRDDD
jgi:hypothetical protein